MHFFNKLDIIQHNMSSNNGSAKAKANDTKSADGKLEFQETDHRSTNCELHKNVPSVPLAAVVVAGGWSSATAAAAAYGLPTMAKYVPKITQTTDGWSTGWSESQRDLFTPIALSVVMTGWNTRSAAMAEATELVYHFWGKKRETCQPHITERAAVCGFIYNVYPLMKEMKEAIKKHSPDIAIKFEQLEKQEEYLNMQKVQGSSESVVDAATVAINSLLERNFGENIIVKPQVKSKTPEISIETFAKHFSSKTQLLVLNI